MLTQTAEAVTGFNQLRELVRSAVETALQSHFEALREDLTTRIVNDLSRSQPGSAAVPDAGRINEATKSIVTGSTQADILAALLNGAGQFAERAGLFVLRSGSFVGWRASGFSGPDFKGVALNSSCSLVARVLRERGPATAPPRDFDSAFLGLFGAPLEDAQVLLVPLIVRDKIAALLYADCGPKGGAEIDAGSLECLVRFAGLWIELAAARKGMAASPEPDVKESEAPSPPPPAAAQAEFPPGAAAGLPVPTREASAAPQGASSSAPAFTAAAQPADEAEVHRKARRFAKLLVDEIKLYNQKKVEEGRTHGDLYSRLKVEIEKSRATYDRRYGQTVAASADYFQQELVRILANNNPALLGSRDSR